jgi:hypothetical protein
MELSHKCSSPAKILTIYREKDETIIQLKPIFIDCKGIILVFFLQNKVHWRFHKGEVTAYAQNIWYFQKNIFI